MKLRFLIVLALFSYSTFNAVAFSPTISEPVLPYDVLTMNSDITTERVYLGELKGDPHMYEFTLGKETDLVVTLMRKQDDNLPLSLIVVRSNDNNRGVAEVGRLKASDIRWEVYHDSLLGMKFSHSQTFNKTISSGVYRIEVSSAENNGKYMLVVGANKQDIGYFSTLGNIHLTQAFFGASIFSMIFSSYVYYPIGIIVLIYLICLTWRKKDFIQLKFRSSDNI